MRNATRRTHPGEILPCPEALTRLLGLVFDRLAVVGYVGRRGTSKRHTMACLCSCGLYVDVPVLHLRSGNTKSCGCRQRDAVAAKNVSERTHGHASGGKVSPEYRCWQAIKNRCLNPNVPEFPLYGGRGIRICDEWRDSFEAFLRDVGSKPSRRLSLDRIDPDGHYEPGNVRWATTIEQNRNLRTTVLYEMDGRKQPLGAWADEYGMPREVVNQRISKWSWSLHDALTVPTGGAGPKLGATHQDEGRRLYGIWYAMISRCHNQSDRVYDRYGGRGIQVCERWRNSFEDFLADVGERPSLVHTIDRIDNDRGYGSDNVRWATATEQNRNRRGTKKYELAGQSRTLAEWADLAGISYERVKQRILVYGWDLDEALGTPVVGTGRCPKDGRRRFVPPPP